MKQIISKYQNYIKGIWCDPQSGEWMEQVNPGNGETVTSVPASGPEDICKAVSAAKTAFYEEDWAFNPRKRSAAMFAWAARMRQKHEELSRLLTKDTGKPLKEARMEITGAIGYLEFYASATRTLYGSSTAIDKYSYSIIAREPVGIVGVIVPWNYPVTLLMRDLAPALAAGNVAVVKPAEQTTAVTLECIKLMNEIADFPTGVLNAVSGFGNTAGLALVQSGDVDMISFTGGTATGKVIMTEGAKTMKKLSLELGGKSANIIFEDADLEKALPFAIKAIFTNAGQLCTVGSRLLVQESIAGEVVGELKKRVEALKIGNGYDETTDMGPVISEKQMNRIMKYLEAGRESSQVVTGGERHIDGDCQKGFFIKPTVFLNPPNDCCVVQEEIFGPVLTVQTFKDAEEAVRLANSTAYGLASAVWSRNVDLAMSTARQLRAGTVWINTYNRLFPELETGGYKESGVDRAGGMEGILKYTEVKHICVDFTPNT